MALTLTISKKLILAFLGLTLVVLVSTLGLARWSFEQGFLDYVNALEEQRLEPLAGRLAQEYQASGNSWATLSEQGFEALLREYSSELNDEVNRSGRAPPPDFRHFPETASAFTPPHPGPPGRPPSLGPPTALFGSDGEFLAGRSFPSVVVNAIRVPVTVGGKKIGELRSAPRRHFDSLQETEFSRQQWNTSGLIAVVAMVLAILISMLLTRVLLAPIRRTISGISRMSNGDYSTRLNETRKDELGKLMRDLDHLAYKLQQNQASRKRWLADISHELRTPLTVLTGEIETMKDGIRPLNMQQVHSLDQEVIRLRHLVDDLYELSVSDIGGLRYTFGEVDAKQSIITAVETIQMRANEKNIELQVSGHADKMIRADNQRLDQLFINLLENSLAYTDAPGRIEISLSTRGDAAIINIQDTPPGVNADECNKLFEPLYRHEISRSRRTAGVGLGLAICRNIVDAHQGSITASPSELGGLRIQVVLPVSVNSP